MHFGSARRREHTHTFAECCAAGDHIVEQQNAHAPHIGKAAQTERTAHIGGAAARVQQLLFGLCPARATSSTRKLPPVSFVYTFASSRAWS